jgi:hypothetical protein
VNIEQVNERCQPLAPAIGAPVPVLMYHSVSDAPVAATRALSVRPTVFAAQLRYLRRQGFSGLTFGELCRRRRTSQPLPARPIVLTFDEGYADLIEARGMRVIKPRPYPRVVYIKPTMIAPALSSPAQSP